MATPTYTPIASVTLGSSQNSVEFTSIPQDYRDLVLVINTSVSTVGALEGEMYFNSDTSSSNYSIVTMGGSGSSAFASSSASKTAILFDADLGMNIVQIMDYSATDKHKTSLIRTSNPSDRVEAASIRWANTSAITSVEITDQTNTFDSGSTFSLFGIAS